MSMSIQRIIHGEPITIELTHDEIATAYLHHEHYYDCEYVRQSLDFWEPFDGLDDAAIEAAIHEIAYEKRRQQDKYKYDECDALEKAKEMYQNNHPSPTPEKGHSAAENSSDTESVTKIPDSAIRVYFDKFGRRIVDGMHIRMADGSMETVVETVDQYGQPDLGISASNAAYLKNHPDADQEYYSLNQFRMCDIEIIF